MAVPHSSFSQGCFCSSCTLSRSGTSKLDLSTTISDWERVNVDGHFSIFLKKVTFFSKEHSTQNTEHRGSRSYVVLKKGVSDKNGRTQNTGDRIQNFEQI